MNGYARTESFRSGLIPSACIPGSPPFRSISAVWKLYGINPRRSLCRVLARIRQQPAGCFAEAFQKPASGSAAARGRFQGACPSADFMQRPVPARLPGTRRFRKTGQSLPHTPLPPDKMYERTLPFSRKQLSAPGKYVKLNGIYQICLTLQASVRRGPRRRRSGGGRETVPIQLRTCIHSRGMPDGREFFLSNKRIPFAARSNPDGLPGTPARYGGKKAVRTAFGSCEYRF